MMMIQSKLIGAAVIAALTIQGCSEGHHDRSSSGVSSPSQNIASPAPATITSTEQPWVRASRWSTDAVTPPSEYYRAVMKGLRKNSSSLNLVDQDTTASDTPVLYVDFNGENLVYGFEDGESFILCKDEATLPASGLTLTEQQAVLAEVQAYFDLANASLFVTNIRPTSGDYTSIFVTGAIDDLGCEKEDRVLGIAPVDKGNKNPNDIGFAFMRNIDRDEDDLVYTASVVIAHEAGHTFGLKHDDNVKSIMYASVQEDVIGFAIGKARKLIFKAIQDSPYELRKVLGVLDPDLLDDEEQAENSAGLRTNLCGKILDLQSFILGNFANVDPSATWLKVPSLCE